MIEILNNSSLDEENLMLNTFHKRLIKTTPCTCRKFRSRFSAKLPIESRCTPPTPTWETSLKWTTFSFRYARRRTISNYLRNKNCLFTTTLSIDFGKRSKSS